MAKNTIKSLRDLESLIQKTPFVAQTANGSAKPTGLGFNQQQDAPRNPKAKEGGPWQTPRSNRTGE